MPLSVRASQHRNIRHQEDAALQREEHLICHSERSVRREESAFSFVPCEK